MKNYIGVKQVYAELMTIEQFIESKQHNEPQSQNMLGYKVTYADGYVSWCPKEVFDKYYFPIEHPETVTMADIDNFVNRGKLDTETLQTDKERALDSGLAEKVIIKLPNSWTEEQTCDVTPTMRQADADYTAADEIAKRILTYFQFMQMWANEGLS